VLFLQLVVERMLLDLAYTTDFVKTIHGLQEALDVVGELTSLHNLYFAGSDCLIACLLIYV